MVALNQEAIHSAYRWQLRLCKKNLALEAALATLKKRYTELHYSVFGQALRQKAGDHALLNQELTEEEILHLLQDYDFEAAIRQYQRRGRNRKFFLEACSLLAERHKKSQPHSWREGIFHLLREVTGAKNMNEILEMNLSADDILRLLKDYDFDAQD